MYFEVYDWDKSSYLNAKIQIRNEGYRSGKTLRKFKDAAVNLTNFTNPPSALVAANSEYWDVTGYSDAEKGEVKMLDGTRFIEAMGGFSELPKPKNDSKHGVPTAVVDMCNEPDAKTVADFVSPYQREVEGVSGGLAILPSVSIRDFIKQYKAKDPTMVAMTSRGTMPSSYTSTYNYSDFAGIRCTKRLADKARAFLSTIGDDGFVYLRDSQFIVKSDTRYVASDSTQAGYTRDNIYFIKSKVVTSAAYVEENELYEDGVETGDTVLETNKEFGITIQKKEVYRADANMQAFSTTAIKEVIAPTAALDSEVEDERREYLEAAQYEELEDESTYFSEIDGALEMLTVVRQAFSEQGGIVEVLIDGNNGVDRYYKYNTFYTTVAFFKSEMLRVCDTVDELYEAYEESYGNLQDTTIGEYMDLFGSLEEYMETSVSGGIGDVIKMLMVSKIALTNKSSTIWRGTPDATDATAYGELIKRLGSRQFGKVFIPMVEVNGGASNYELLGYMVNWDEFQKLPPGAAFIVLSVVYGYLHWDVRVKKSSWISKLGSLLMIAVVVIASYGTLSGPALTLTLAGSAISAVGIITGNEDLVAIGGYVSMLGGVISGLGGITNLVNTGITMSLAVQLFGYALQIGQMIQQHTYDGKIADLQKRVDRLVANINEMEELITEQEALTKIESFIYGGAIDTTYTHRYDYDYNYQYYV